MNVRSLTVLLPALVLGAATAQAPEPAAPPAAAHDLRLVRAQGRPVLVTLSQRFDLKLEVQGVAIRKGLQARHESVLLDEITAMTPEGTWTGSRRFVKRQKTENGTPADDELNGLTLAYQGPPEKAEVAGDRMVRKTLLEELLAQAGSLGLWLALPGAATLKQGFSVDFGAVASLLLDADGALEQCQAELALAEVDPKKKTATLQGTVRAEDQEDLGGVPAVAAYDLAATVELNLEEHRVARLRLSGRVAIRSEKAVLAGDGTVEVVATTAVGAAAEAARTAAPAHREVPRELKKLGLAVTLPSHWFLGGTEKEQQFFSAWHEGSLERAICFQTFPLGGLSMKEFLQACENALLKEVPPGVKSSDVAGPSGGGRAHRFANEGREFLVEFLPLGKDRVVRGRVYSPAKGFPAVLRDYEKARRTLKPLAP
jgi:hypothetical protein